MAEEDAAGEAGVLGKMPIGIDIADVVRAAHGDADLVHLGEGERNEQDPDQAGDRLGHQAEERTNSAYGMPGGSPRRKGVGVLWGK